VITYVELMSKSHDAQNYHCGHFLLDAWMFITKQDISCAIGGLLLPLDQCNMKGCDLTKLKWIDEPEDPCIMSMRNARGLGHVGIYVKGKMLHLAQHYPCIIPLEQVMTHYRGLRYYAVQVDKDY